MSSQGAKRSTWVDTPPEVLLQIVSELDPLSQLNVAIAYPEIFLRPGFNIFRQDAEQQVRKYNPLLRTPVPFTETPETWPLLWTAIKNDIDIQFIKDMLNIYMSICPTSIDGIWGEYFTALPPPLTFAAAMGRPQVISLLLEKGANPYRHCTNHIFPTGFLPNCDCRLELTNHAQCATYGRPLDPTSDSEDTPCLTSMMAVLAEGIQLSSPASIQAQALEECAMILYDKGVPLPLASLPSPDPLILLVANITRAGFCRLARTVLDPLVPLKQGEPAFRVTMYRILLDACWNQPSDDDRAIIEYLVSIGAPLVPDSNLYFDSAAHTSVIHGHMKTAAFLLDQHADQRLSLDYSDISWRASGNTVPFVKALYRAMEGGNHLHQGREVSTQALHSLLLKAAVKAGDEPAVQWLTEQGCK